MQEEQRLVSASEAQVATSFESGDNSTSQAALESDMDKTVVRLNSVTEGRPLFILHGAGGGILVMQKVARKINCPVYGVQDTLEAPLTGTLDRLSHFYLSKIKERQPSGPYRLAGFSFGGPTFGIVDWPLTLWLLLTGTCLAFIIANILQTEGEKVEVLIMLDGAPTLFDRPMFGNYSKRMITEGTLRDDVRVFVLPLDSLAHDDHLRWIDLGHR